MDEVSAVYGYEYGDDEFAIPMKAGCVCGGEIDTLINGTEANAFPDDLGAGWHGECLFVLCEVGCLL
jgi:hypothetical protein